MEQYYVAQGVFIPSYHRWVALDIVKPGDAGACDEGYCCIRSVHTIPSWPLTSHALAACFSSFYWMGLMTYDWPQFAWNDPLAPQVMYQNWGKQSVVGAVDQCSARS